MFTISYRNEVREKIITKAKADERIVSAAAVGSYAKGTVDQWSDIDLTFGVDESFTIISLLDSWTEYVVQEFSGVFLLDVKRGNTIYRVFVLPGCLQLDLSFSPAKEFGADGPHFHLLYGKKYIKPQPKSQQSNEIFGWMLHHILRARFCVERKRLWQAEYWISEARNYALKLACISRALNTEHGRGFDDLPHEILDLFKTSFITNLNREEFLRVINDIIEALPKISEEVNQMTKTVHNILAELKYETTLRK